MIDDFLEHHGVKGMRWGHRKNASGGGKPSRKERKIAEKQARLKADTDKAHMLIDKASKKPDTLILLNGHTVVTGKEFVDHMIAGGLLNVSSSRIYAEMDKKAGGYVLQ